jgi:DNA-binding IclR family transcriptional regulator
MSDRTVSQALLFHLARLPGAVHRDTLAKAAGTSRDYAGRVLSRMVRSGRVTRVGRGKYRLTRFVKAE